MQALNNQSKDKIVLTTREIDYLSLVALGYHNDVIAKILFVSTSTVKKTLENIFKKLNAKDRANAVAIAFIHKIITMQSLSEFEGKYNLINIE